MLLIVFGIETIITKLNTLSVKKCIALLRITVYYSASNQKSLNYKHCDNE